MRAPRAAPEPGAPSAPEYASSTGNVQYQYRLEGADRDWQRPTGNGTVTFANLPAGSYRFVVRAFRRGGLVVGPPATVAFTIVPPFWQRGWFLGLIAVMSMAIAYAIHRYRVTQLLAVERIRTRIATELHDDIGSSLSRIAILSEVAARRLDRRVTDVGETLDSIGQTAGELVDSMSTSSGPSTRSMTRWRI